MFWDRTRDQNTIIPRIYRSIERYTIVSLMYLENTLNFKPRRLFSANECRSGRLTCYGIQYGPPIIRTHGRAAFLFYSSLIHGRACGTEPEEQSSGLKRSADDAIFSLRKWIIIGIACSDQNRDR